MLCHFITYTNYIVAIKIKVFQIKDYKTIYIIKNKYLEDYPRILKILFNIWEFYIMFGN